MATYVKTPDGYISIEAHEILKAMAIPQRLAALDEKAKPQKKTRRKKGAPVQYDEQNRPPQVIQGDYL